MNENLIYVCLIVSLIILMIYFNNQSNNEEQFDTYRNHDYGAYDEYKSKDNNCLTVDEAALKSKYIWSERDKAGYTVYDQYYNADTLQKSLTSDYEYGYRDVNPDDDNVYDSKFSTLNNENELSRYKYQDMVDPNIIGTSFNGQNIYLAQKQH